MLMRFAFKRGPPATFLTECLTDRDGTGEVTSTDRGTAVLAGVVDADESSGIV